LKHAPGEGTRRAGPRALGGLALWLGLACSILLEGGCGAGPGTVPTGAGNPPDVLRGWNTWNNPSLLSHVLLPEGFALNLVFRNTRGGPFWLRESYVRNAPVPKDRERIRPGLRTYDGRYTELVLEWAGVRADIASATDGDDLVLLYSPREDSSGERILILETAMLWNRPGHLGRSGDRLEADLPGRRIQVGSTLPCTGVELPLGSPYWTFRTDREVAFFTGRRRSLPEIKALLANRRREAEARAARFGPLAEAALAMTCAVAWNQIYDAEHDRVVASVSRTWNEAWGGLILFEWDTYFNAWMAALEDPPLAQSNALAMTTSITPEGLVPNVAASFGVKSSDRSQPPVGSLTVKMLFDRFGDRSFVGRVYPELLRWNRWWNDHRENRGFLSWGSDPHPQGLDDAGTKHTAQFESGLDNSPLFDDARFDPGTHRMALASVDLLSLYIVDCRALGCLAEALGRSAEARELRDRAGRFGAKLQELWDEPSGIYRDRDLDTGRPSPHLSPGNFYPLLTGLPTPEQARRMVDGHLLNPAEFGGDWMIPSIARSDPAFHDNNYWRGRIWGPMNFLVYLGLTRYELPEARRRLAERSVALLLKEWRLERHVHENYNSESGAGDDVPSSNSFYSWGGLLGLIGLIEQGHFPLTLP